MILFFNEQNFFKFSALKKIYVYIYKSQKYDLTSRVRKKKASSQCPIVRLRSGTRDKRARSNPLAATWN